MMQDDSAALRVLSIGGTGTISSSCVRLSLERGDVGQRLERGQQQRGSATARRRDLADGRRDGRSVPPRRDRRPALRFRRFVSGFAPKLTFHRAALRMIQWRADYPDTTGADETTDAVLDRIVDAYHASRDVFANYAPQPVGAVR